MTTPYVATGPEDLIALAPTVLRFDPQNSVVVMTFGRPGRSFHARVDLPHHPRDQEEVAITLVEAMRQNHLRACAVLLYSEDRRLAAAQARTLSDRLSAAGIRVIDILLVTGDRYFRVLRDDDEGTVFDLSSHPFTARRVLDGLVVHKSREDLAATLMPDEAATTAFADIRDAVPHWSAQRDPAAEGQWLRTTASQMLAGGSLSDADLSRLLAALLEPGLLDVAWALIDHERAGAHVELWRGVVRRAPEELVAGPACLLAFAAWLAGDGALAWCGVDRCPDPGLPMVRMLSELLQAAVPPRLWPGLTAEELSSLRGPAA